MQKGLCLIIIIILLVGCSSKDELIATTNQVVELEGIVDIKNHEIEDKNDLIEEKSSQINQYLEEIDKLNLEINNLNSQLSEFSQNYDENISILESYKQKFSQQEKSDKTARIYRATGEMKNYPNNDSFRVDELRDAYVMVLYEVTNSKYEEWAFIEVVYSSEDNRYGYILESCLEEYNDSEIVLELNSTSIGGIKVGDSITYVE